MFGTVAERVVWAVSVTGQWLVWLALLGIHRFVPDQLRISVWRPAELFRTPLVLSLDPTGWTMAFVIATILLAIGLTSSARTGSATPATRAFLSIYGALSMAAVIAGNLLTLAVIWAMIEVVAFATSLVLVGQREIIPAKSSAWPFRGPASCFSWGLPSCLGPVESLAPRDWHRGGLSWGLPPRSFGGGLFLRIILSLVYPGSAVA